jgi:hypothetical protein
MLEILLRETHAEHLMPDILLRKKALDVPMPEFLFLKTGADDVLRSKKQQFHRVFRGFRRFLPKNSPATDDEGRFGVRRQSGSGDGAFGRTMMIEQSNRSRACESGVALRLPPQSKTRSAMAGRNLQTGAPSGAA